jgi:hypothetical protein
MGTIIVIVSYIMFGTVGGFGESVVPMYNSFDVKVTLQSL